MAKIRFYNLVYKSGFIEKFQKTIFKNQINNSIITDKCPSKTKIILKKPIIFTFHKKLLKNNSFFNY
jgi:hypothetical protein